MELEVLMASTLRRDYSGTYRLWNEGILYVYVITLVEDGLHLKVQSRKVVRECRENIDKDQRWQVKRQADYLVQDVVIVRRFVHFGVLKSHEKQTDDSNWIKKIKIIWDWDKYLRKQITNRAVKKRVLNFRP